MTLSIAIKEARRNTATAANRQRQIRAEMRLDEIVKVAGIADEYATVDRAGDLDIETNFGRLWHAAETEQMRDLIARTFAAWMRDEEREEAVLRGAVDGAVTLLKSNNPTFIENVYVPAGSDAVA